MSTHTSFHGVTDEATIDVRGTDQGEGTPKWTDLDIVNDRGERLRLTLFGISPDAFVNAISMSREQELLDSNS